MQTKGAVQVAHSGSRFVEWGDVRAVVTPAGTCSWQPIAHEHLVAEVKQWFNSCGLTIKKEQHALAKDGARYFGTWDLTNGHGAPDYGLALGLRNSHDKSFPAGLCVGSRVFVCDNLAFSGEITLARKHTRFILRDLPRLVGDAFGRLQGMRQTQDKRILAYKEHALNDWQVHDALIRAVDAKVIPNADVPKVLVEWRQPKHEDFKPRTAWSLFNGFTEVAKGWNPQELPGRTQRLHALVDGLAGLVSSQALAASN